MQLIKLVFESLCRALIRFFDNRFNKDNRIEWYQMELDKRSTETQRIIDHLLMPRVVTPEVEENDDFVPIQKTKFKSWDTKRKELENQSRLRAQALALEASIAMQKNKTTAELEEELGIVNG